MTLPAICNELRLHDDAGTPVVSSRDVAEVFGKRHDNALRDIEFLLGQQPPSNLRGGTKSMGYEDSVPEKNWFRPATYFDQNGQERPAFNLTRQGFTLLVMGWTGERAMTFKVRYIEAFDAMETALRSVPSGLDMASMIVSGLKEAIAPLAVRFDTQDYAINNVAAKVDVLDGRMTRIERAITKKGRRISASTKAQHVRDVFEMGGFCPCCGVAKVVDENGIQSSFSEHDHFYENSLPNIEHTWLICKPDHAALTTGRVARHLREAEFRSYQGRRERLPGRQPTLFG